MTKQSADNLRRSIQAIDEDLSDPELPDSWDRAYYQRKRDQYAEALRTGNWPPKEATCPRCKGTGRIAKAAR